MLRTDRRDRRLRGKSDTIDAENAARAVFNGQASAVPKSADGTVMIRLVKVAKDVAVKARTSAMISLKAVLVNAPGELREQLEPLTKMALIRRCAALLPGPVTDPMTAAKHTLRAIARRWLALDAEIKAHQQVSNRLTTELVPDLVAAFGIGADIAAEMLIVAGDNPERVRSEPAFARLCGVAPIPASSGMTTRHRLNCGGHRQANAALYRTVIVRLHHQPTQAYYQRKDGRGPHQSRNHPLSQALVSPRDMELSATAPPSQATTRSCCLTAIGVPYVKQRLVDVPCGDWGRTQHRFASTAR